MFVLYAAVFCAMPIDVGDQKQLFIDRKFIAESDRVELRTNPAQKIGTISDESGNPLMGHISRVIDDNGTVKLYLGADSVDLYESGDGLKFKRTGHISGAIFTTYSSISTIPIPRADTSASMSNMRRRSIRRSMALSRATRPTA
jgi:hypothetical protein